MIHFEMNIWNLKNQHLNRLQKHFTSAFSKIEQKILISQTTNEIISQKTFLNKRGYNIVHEVTYRVLN